MVEAGEIDDINILQAALKAMEGAAAGLAATPDFLLVDGNRLPKVGRPLLACPAQHQMFARRPSGRVFVHALVPLLAEAAVHGTSTAQGFDPERSRPIIKGDSKCYCIAAASVIAKVTRDRIMEQHHARWPHYNFAGALTGRGSRSAGQAGALH